MKPIDIVSRIYRRLLRGIIDATFNWWEKLGLHVTVNHYYQPVPDTRYLDDRLWSNISQIPGIDINEAAQINLLQDIIPQFKREYDALPRTERNGSTGFYLNNQSFESVDAEILYCFVRHFKPTRIIEIGSGFSTYLTAQAVEINEREDPDCKCEFVAIEPYPRESLKRGVTGLSKLHAMRVQDVPPEQFETLGQNDILFIDSSHVLKIGGDVQYEYLEIIPRLAGGVIVHVHDIFLPAEYPREWVLKNHYFWTEQYLLQAFLAFNSDFEVMWAGSYMHLNHPDLLERAFRSYDKETVWPGSFWMRRKM